MVVVCERSGRAVGVLYAQQTGRYHSPTPRCVDETRPQTGSLRACRSVPGRRGALYVSFACFFAYLLPMARQDGRAGNVDGRLPA